jgi:hypothetical protein
MAWRILWRGILIKKGVFSVKSAYHLGISLKETKLCKDDSGSSADRPPLWNNIWNLKLPGKVRIFLWRLCHNSLPTKLNIQRKRVDLDTRCPVCFRMDEDGGHLFLKCKLVKQVWRELLLEDIRMQCVGAPNAMSMMEMILGLPNERKCRHLSFSGLVD